MQIVTRIRTALVVLTLAMSAVTVVAAPTAALAAQTGPGNQPIPNVPHTPAPQTGTGRHKPAGPPPLDVSVTTVGHSGGNYGDSYMVVAYDLKTTGADAGVVLKSECNYRRFNDTEYRRNEPKPNGSMTLYANWPAAVPYTVTCSRLYDDEWVSSVILTADAGPTDANPSNNTGVWDAWTGK